MHVIPHGSWVRRADVVPGYKKPEGDTGERLFEERIATSVVLPEPYRTEAEGRRARQSQARS